MREHPIARAAGVLALSGFAMLGSDGPASGGNSSEAFAVRTPPGQTQPRFDPANPPPIELLAATGAPRNFTYAALRKLWMSDPVWALPERLDFHNLDYAFPTVPQIVETKYRVGQGYLDAAAAPAEAAPAIVTSPAGARPDREPPPSLKNQAVTWKDVR